MKLDDFISMLELARNSRTLYVMGCFGAPLNDKNKQRYTTNHPYNQKPERKRMIMAATSDTFGFDCVNLIKGVLWGWNSSENLVYGGAKYKSNGVPDVSADGMIKLCNKVSTNFSNIERGEAVWMSGHIGIYVGDGKVIECTPKWSNNVQYSNLGNIGYTSGNCRFWQKHGFLPWVEYNISSTPETPQNAQNTSSGDEYYTIKAGDTFDRIAKAHGLTRAQLKALNPQITNINKIYAGKKIRVK